MNTNDRGELFVNCSRSGEELKEDWYDFGTRQRDALFFSYLPSGWSVYHREAKLSPDKRGSDFIVRPPMRQLWISIDL